MMQGDHRSFPGIHQNRYTLQNPKAGGQSCLQYVMGSNELTDPVILFVASNILIRTSRPHFFIGFDGIIDPEMLFDMGSK